ncbi:MAG: TVP38/TMEM64 family protein [Clostridium argentinense]|nr:TVP38/TMEM64 family protein [Clostridium argentinense]
MFMRYTFNKINKYKGYILLGILIIIGGFIGYEYFFKYADLFKNPENIKEIILSYGKYSVLIFILIQILQVVVFFIPGEVIQIAGGYVFGSFLGTIISSVGILIGSAIGYFIARYLARDIVRKIIEKRNLKHFRKILTKSSNKIVILIVYLIPGIPKDILIYLCGLSDVNFLDFLLYSSIGRLPGIIISALFGDSIGERNYIVLGSLAIISIIFFLIGIFKGNKILEYLHQFHNKRKKGKEE